jgi:hypothetical protein
MNNERPCELPSEAPKSASTGPRTPAGKAISSQNARKHDLCSRTLRLSPEEWAEYNDMCERYRRDLEPVGDVEQTLVDEMCFNYWRLQQAREAELTAITGHPIRISPYRSLHPIPHWVRARLLQSSRQAKSDPAHPQAKHQT